MTRNLFLIGFGLLLVAGIGPSSAAESYGEGFEYHNISPPQPTSTSEQVEVVELFWYGCPHCYSFEPELDAWLEKKPQSVKFVRMPAVFRPSWEVHARAFYTAEALGVVDKIHRPLFDAIHKERRQLSDQASLRSFFVEQGVDGDEFDKTYSSFLVLAKVNRAKDMSRRYGVHGVPSMVVNGKYWTDAKSASLSDTRGARNENMLKVVEYLIEQEETSVARTETGQ